MDMYKRSKRMKYKSDKEWFSEQVVQQQDCMYRYAFSILKNDSDTKDVMQDAIIKAYENLDSLKEPKKFKTWIITILKNCVYDFLRKKKYLVDIDEKNVAEKGKELFVEEKIDLYDAIQQLPLAYRTTIILYYFENMKIKDISVILDESSATVRKRLSRAREKLREILKDYKEV